MPPIQPVRATVRALTPTPMFWSKRSAPTHFPEVRGTRLDGTPVAIPADLPADATVLVVSFRGDLDPVSDQWARLVERIAPLHEGRVAVWEVPVMGRAMRALGEIHTATLRHGMDDDAEAARTVPIYVDVKDFRKALGLKGSNTVTAFLVDRSGRIAWTGEDTVDLDEIAALETALAEILAAPSEPMEPEDG